MTNSIAEIEDAGCIFVIGSNTTACHPLVARRILKAKEKGARLIVADPRNIQIGRFADIAVQHRLGSDVALLNGMMHVIIANKWHDAGYIETRTENFQSMAALLEEYTPERVQAITLHFDGLIREAELSSRDMPTLLRTLVNQVDEELHATD